MAEYELSELQYSNDRQEPFKLYIYEPNSPYHRGVVWFMRVPRYPDEITCSEAMVRALEAEAQGREVRICDGGDMLIYHAKGTEVLYPKPIGDFWKEIGA